MTKYMCGWERGKECMFFNEIRCSNYAEHTVECPNMIEVTLENLMKMMIELKFSIVDKV